MRASKTADGEEREQGPDSMDSDGSEDESADAG